MDTETNRHTGRQLCDYEGRIQDKARLSPGRLYMPSKSSETRKQEGSRFSHTAFVVVVELLNHVQLCNSMDCVRESAPFLLPGFCGFAGHI